MFFNRNARALAHAQMQWLGLAYKTPNKELMGQVKERLRKHQGFKADGDILLTKVGFASIAIHVEHAVTFQGFMIAPGVNHKGKQGYLVLDNQTAPYFSQAPSAREAIQEAMRAPFTQKLRISHV